MLNDDELNGCGQDDVSSPGAQEMLGRWMRIPEAWAALRGLSPAEVDRLRTPFDLAAAFASRQAGSATHAPTWADVASADKQTPIDFDGVMRLAAALRDGAEAGLTAEIARVTSARPDVWLSPIAVAWPTLPCPAALARDLIALGGPSGASLLANALLASSGPSEAATSIRELLGENSPAALAVLIQAGENDLAAALADSLPASKDASITLDASLDGAARAQAQGNLSLARQTLIDGWDRATELGATFGDRLADVAIAQSDPVSACEALKRALLLQPTRERRARVAALLAEMGRAAQAQEWLAEPPETMAEHIAAAVVTLAAGDHQLAAAHVGHAVAGLPSDPGISVGWLQRLAAAAQKLEHPHLAVPALERLARLRPEDVNLRASLAKHLLAVGEANGAATHALALCGLMPGSDDARRLLARSMQDAGKTEQALAQWEALAHPTAEDRLEAGECALTAGKPADAMHIARGVLSSTPGSPAALAMLGRALMAAGKPADALAHLQAACAGDPRQPAAWTAIAECQAASGDPQASGNTLAAAVQAAPGDGSLWHAYAAWLRKEGRTSEALEAAAQSIDGADAPLEWHIEYGELLNAMGHCDRAAEVLRNALSHQPSSWPVRRALAEALIGTGRTAEAASTVGSLSQDADPDALVFAGRVLAMHASVAHDAALARRAIAFLDRSPNDTPSPEAQISMAEALETCGELDLAFNRYHSALDESNTLTGEDHLAASLGLARCATALHRVPAAIHTLETAAAAHGTSAELDVALSAAYAAAGQHRRAFEAAQRASELAPSEMSLRQLTLAASQAGETATALEAVHKLASLEPSNPHVWLSLAELSAQANDASQARHALATGIRLAREDASAWSRASDLLMRNTRPISAQRALRRALACAPLDADLVRQMAEVSQHAGDNLTAQRAWIRFGELRTDDPQGLKLAARSLSLLGQRAMAIGLWQRAVSLDPQDTDAQSDLARAYLTEGDAVRALAHYRSVTSACPTNIGLALEAAAAELHYGSPDAAVELFRSAAQQAPQEPAAWQGLGEGLLMLSRSHEARPALETAYRLDPTRVHTMAALAIAALDTGDAPMAAATYQSAQRHACENAPAAAALARAALALLQWEEALTALDHLNSSAPSLASLRAGVETRLRLSDAAWIFQTAGAQRHMPYAEWPSESAAAEVQALLDKLAGVAPSWEADRLRQRARVTFGLSDPSTLVDAARSDPSGEALEGLAIALLRKGRAEEAIGLVGPGTTSPSGRWQHLITGIACSALGRLEQARQAFHEAGSDAALRPLAGYMSARTYLNQGDPAAFAAQAGNALVEWNDEPAWHFELANAYLQLGQPDTALPHLHQAAGLAPQVCDYALALARTTQQVGDLPNAQSAYAQAVKCSPSVGQLWKEAGLCALSNGDAATAKEWLESARRLLPGDVETLVGSARAGLAAEEVREAHQHVQAAYHLAPDNSEVLQVLGQVFARQGKLDRALQSFDQALRRAGDPLPVHVARSRLLIQIGRGEQAVAALKAAIAETPNSDAGWAALAEIEDAAGTLPEALDACARAVQLAPRNPGHRMQLGRLCRKSGQLDRALDELLRAQADGCNDGRLLFEIGRVYEERREFKRSLDAYQRAIDIDPTHGEAHYRAGLVLKQIKAYPQAGRMLKRAVELNPKDPEALHQLAAVRALELVHGGIAQQVVAQ
jgi:tetratricopeptide (TPR) repeat protein